MYTFRLYYRVRGAKRRRVKVITVKDDTLAEAWERALNCSILLTCEDEVLNSIQIIGEAATNDN